VPRGTAAVTKISEYADRDPFDFPPNTAYVKYMGVTYNFRELTVAETDQAREDSTIGDKFDGRLMTRLMIVASATEPTMDIEQLAKLPQRLYAAIVDKVNDLNDPEALQEDPGKS
jgi:hypothetical protein